MSTPESRLRLATTLIEQSPPGQVNDVLNDLRIILGDESPTLRHYLLEHLRSYNLEHLQSVVLPGSNDRTLLCKAAVVPQTGPDPAQERYVDPRSKRTFLFDHTTHLTCTHSSTNRAALDTSLQTYIQDHFSSSASACAVFSSSLPDVPVSAASTIATEDAEEEQATLKQEDEALDTTQGTEEGTESIVQSEETAIDPSATAEAGESGEEAGDSLLTKVAETIKDVVTAAVEKQGDEAAVNDTSVAQPVDALKQEAVPEDRVQDNDKSLEGQLIPAINSDLETSDQAQSVQPEPPSEPTYTIAIAAVCRQLTFSAFFIRTGQWRSTYSVNPSDGSIEGIIQVDVHYFENGNVQLEAKERVSLSIDTQSDNLASTIITAIAKNEQAYQMQLNSTYDDLGEKNFKS
ncbi:hypothetical protein QFC24_000326 [Naganishia onofrii]|uniref:Uncharacterized protein n=1 Tax=Naganishia onofrii TaxID=1851511 RepID=A0ACC2XVJ0_9TREE|nr:hypothetical protein QFC24_000326 [Naganishia onofrii]